MIVKVTGKSVGMKEYEFEILDCPCCEGKPELEIKEKAYSICGDPSCCGMGDLLVLECRDCGLKMEEHSPYNYGNERKEMLQTLVDSWNKRAQTL